MSKCTIHTINQRIQEKFPHLEYELIEHITSTYFKTIREGIEGLKNIEVTILFGEFKISIPKTERKMNMYKKIIENQDDPEKNRYSQEKIDRLKEKITTLEELSLKRQEFIKRRGKVIERTGKKEKRPTKSQILDAIEKEIELKKEMKK